MTFAPAPMVLDEVLDKDWLSRALSTDGGPVEVRGVETVEILGPSALKIRLKLDLAEAPTGMPREICIKGIFDPALSLWLKSGAQEAEANFYKILAPKLSVRVPRPLYAGFDPATMAGLVVMEDLIPKGVRFLTALSPYTPAQARSSLDQLARLHGGGWTAAEAGGEPWITPRLAALAASRPMAPERLTEVLHGERGEALPAEVKDGPRIYAALLRIAERAEQLGHTFVHGDAHAGNVWEGPDGAGLVDWQTLQRGHWSMDVAYHIAAALEVEERRRSERDLLRHYLERLAAHGGPALAFEEAWPQYQAAAPYGLFMWGITLRVEPPIIRQFVTRLGTAAADHESFARLGV